MKSLGIMIRLLNYLTKLLSLNRGEILNILLTNDDGVYSQGLAALAGEISKIATVTIVAPDRERSATAHAITMHKPLRVEKVDLPVHNVTAWKINGTPSDCVKIALEALLDFTPDMVLSGINQGPNLGTDVIYSGTVSAAIEAAISGVPSVAFSITAYENINYNQASVFAGKLCHQISKYDFPNDALLNVNIPPITEEEIKGLYITHLGTRKYKNSFDKRKDPRGRTYYWMAGEVIEDLNDVESDVWAIRNNYISITPLKFNLTNYDIIETIRQWNIKI
jgi:5'-nucleotidase